MPHWDAFISHAHEDKESVARPLAVMLERRGVRVWLDENELVLGRGLTEQINNGLANSDFGIVVLSPSFFDKGWTKTELGAIMTNAQYREKFLIPVWHQLDHEFLRSRQPLLADRYAARTEAGLAEVAFQILRAVRPGPATDLPSFTQRQELALEFVAGLRTRKWEGRAFEASIGVETMQQIRALLTVADSPHLLGLLADTAVEPGLRNRAASLLFGQRLRNQSTEFKRVVAAAREFYHSNAGTDAWQPLRAVALAVADQAQDGTLILDWLDRIRPSTGLVEANLSMTDTYYNGVRLAVEKYLRRIRDFFRNRPTGRLWEVFYLGRRAVAGDEDVIAVLTECAEVTNHGGLRSLCSESLNLLQAPSTRT